ncbi:signal peptide peptidase SppA [Anaerococcus urinomassiliensis]|uniref:signal peptide peptidase SppA n=1 Tax=Anaerococcus urinomassiliensis TaxID=1745712 RepID=UPI00093E4DE6|nr:signal peptide peptidase SppA [Anaerococcus urinomassiliensis]
MEKNNNKKRWLAAGLALLVLLVSLFTEGKEAKIDENKIRKEAFDKFYQMDEEEIYGSNPLQKISVINVDGVIANDANNDTIVDLLEDARKDPNVAGVIMHINSPGGSVYASEKIYKEIKKLQEENKPVYSVMQELAASGGYYISAPCDKIFASNETFTGSIGVIMQSYSLEGLFEKYGIKEQNITTGKMKDAGSPGKALDKEEKEYLQNLVDSAFSRFVKVVADGRDMSEADVRKLADGRVYDGSQALENGLVDKIGDLDDAYKDMAKEYNLSDPMLVEKSDVFSNFSKYFPGFKSFTDKPKSELQILQELMNSESKKPLYLYGGYYE